MIGAATVMIGGPNIVINSTSIHRGAGVNWRVFLCRIEGLFYGDQRSMSCSPSIGSFFVENASDSGNERRILGFVRFSHERCGHF